MTTNPTCPVCQAKVGVRAKYCSTRCRNAVNNAAFKARCAADPAFRRKYIEQKREYRSKQTGEPLTPRRPPFTCWCGVYCVPGLNGVGPKATTACCRAHADRVRSERQVRSNRRSQALRKLSRASEGTFGRRWKCATCLVCGARFVAPAGWSAVVCGDACRGERQAEKRRRGNRRRKATKRGISSEPYTLAELVERDRSRCQLCGTKVKLGAVVPHPKAPTVDHILPLSKGGDDTRANVQLAHFLCNSTKGDRVLKPEQLRLVA